MLAFWNIYHLLMCGTVKVLGYHWKAPLNKGSSTFVKFLHTSQPSRWTQGLSSEGFEGSKYKGMLLSEAAKFSLIRMIKQPPLMMMAPQGSKKKKTCFLHGKSKLGQKRSEQETEVYGPDGVDRLAASFSTTWIILSIGNVQFTKQFVLFAITSL